MKFLVKNPKSEILAQGLTYKENRYENNKRLNDSLLKKQKYFCAYSEKYINTASVTKNDKTAIQYATAMEVEHFNPEIKFNDDYYNYYSVDRNININKKAQYPNFNSPLFFQSKGGFESKIELFIDEELGLCIYEPKNSNDKEAQNLINYLSLNREILSRQRFNHIVRIKSIFEDLNCDSAYMISYFRKYNDELSYISALEKHLNLNLSEFYS